LTKLIKFIVFWAIGIVLIFFANLALPSNYVLGTYKINSFWAMIFSGFLWVLFLSTLYKILEISHFEVKPSFLKIFVKIIFNFIVLWVIARIAPCSGFGISSYIFVGYLALVGSASQLIISNLFFKNSTGKV